MSEIEMRGAPSSDTGDRRSWKRVSGFLAGRGVTVPEPTDAVELRHEPTGTTNAVQGRRTEAPTEQVSPIASDHLARDMAEIEQAAAALRREEPRLEPGYPGLEAKAELPNVRSVWILIAVIWISVASVVSCAIGAALLLFG
jgi:hypothetical protein